MEKVSSDERSYFILDLKKRTFFLFSFFFLFLAPNLGEDPILYSPRPLGYSVWGCQRFQDLE